ncbi:MAG: hypothetical protein ACTSVM_01880 [Candidatus Ranarchaeia archaeon]
MTMQKVTCRLLTVFLLSIIMVPIAGTFLSPIHNVSDIALVKAQNYDFKVINESVHVYALQDGGVFINYTIAFQNYGDPIDIIDIGFPNSYYDLSSVHAYWDDGSGFQEMTDIRVSTVIDIGVEIHIPSSYQISSGEQGTLVVWGTNPHMIYNDTEHEYYAGFQFSPTWFDPDLCRSVDQLTTYIHFPEGFYNGSLAYWQSEPTGYYFDDHSLVYYWQEGPHTPKQFIYGISFPADTVNTVFPPPTSGGNGDGLGSDELVFILFGGTILLVFIAIFSKVLLSKNRRVQGVGKRLYLPPAVAVEALGIHRGLTVVEAAILMETPLNRVVTMIVFGLLRKGLIRFEEGNPPRIYRLPASKDVRPYYYEIMFLKALTPNGSISPNTLKRTLTTLIKTVARKLEGYSRRQTRAYYKRIMSRAISELASASNPSLQSGAFDKYAEWLLVQPKKARLLRTYDTYYVPPWYWSYYWYFHRPFYRPRRRGTRRGMPLPITSQKPPIGGRKGKASEPIGIPQIADGIATGASNFANTMVLGFTGIANSIVRKLGPPPPRPRRSSYRGHSCACACACVSCACACAGGGR